MAKIYERSLSTIIAQGKFRDSFDPRSQTPSGEESNWKGDRLEITRVVDCFFFFYNTFDLLWLFYIRCFVLSTSVKIKCLTLSVYCNIIFLVSSTEEWPACFPQCFLRTF